LGPEFHFHHLLHLPPADQFGLGEDRRVVLDIVHGLLARLGIFNDVAQRQGRRFFFLIRHRRLARLGIPIVKDRPTPAPWTAPPPCGLRRQPLPAGAPRPPKQRPARIHAASRSPPQSSHSAIDSSQDLENLGVP